jgi:hypothetical protein
MNVRFDEDIKGGILAYPQLHAELKENVNILTGNLDIIDQNGKLWETYNIEIHPTEKYPYRFPLLFESGGKIPRIADWHIYSDSGSCCVDVLPNEIISCKNGLSITDFIKSKAIPYFANQTHRIKEGYYKYGEYSHGIAGLIEYYLLQLKTDDVKKALSWMHNISQRMYSHRSVFHPCFCGSGNKFGKCHSETVQLLSQIEPTELLNHIELIKKILYK